MELNDSKRYYIAIDPGKAGAIVILEENGAVFEKLGMPLIGKDYDWSTVRDLFSDVEPVHVAIENPGVIFGAGKSAVASLHKCVGTLEGLVVGMRIPHTMLKPKVWQKEMWKDVETVKKQSKSGKSKVNDTKATSIKAACKLFPNENFKITNNGNPSKNYNDGMIDATLMCEYIRRKYESQ